MSSNSPYTHMGDVQKDLIAVIAILAVAAAKGGVQPFDALVFGQISERLEYVADDVSKARLQEARRLLSGPRDRD